MSRAESAPHRLGAAAISAAYEAGTLTPIVLVRHLLDRAGRMDPQVHAFIRGEVAKRDARIADSLPILYGGSVKPDNAGELFAQPDVDGGLVGGASLVAADFLAIADAAVGH